MKANLKEDIIIMLTENGKVDIGALPNNVGLERLRFDGKRMVDLFNLNEIWVRYVSGTFELHAVEVPKSQKVIMNYAERKRLFLDGNKIRLLTMEEVTNNEIDIKRKQVLTQLSQRLKGKLGDMTELTLNNTMLIMALIVYTKKQPAVLGNFFDKLAPHIINAFPLNRWEDILTNACVELKDAMTEYYRKIDQI